MDMELSAPQVYAEKAYVMGYPREKFVVKTQTPIRVSIALMVGFKRQFLSEKLGV